MAQAPPRPGTPAPALPPKGRRPNPQIAQLKRTLYFLTRNTLAVVGLGIIVFFVVVAVGSFADPAPNSTLVQECGTYGSSGNLSQLCPGGVVCTYLSGTSPPGPNCYPVGEFTSSQIAPTIDLGKLSHGVTAALGPLPFGSLTTSPDNPYFYNPFTGLIKGSEWSLGISVGVVLSGALIGLVLGSISGFFGGVVDEVIMRITEIFLAIPALLLTLVVLAVLAGNPNFPEFASLTGRIELLMLAFIITWWPLYTRIVRGQVLVTREQKYVEAARASGARSGRIIRSHIVPNSIYPVLVQFSLDVGAVPLAIANIIFLGFPIFPNAQTFPEWGTIAAVGVQPLIGTFNTCAIGTCQIPWWQILFPGLTLFLFAISVNFLSDGLRDALDPRLRR